MALKYERYSSPLLNANTIKRQAIIEQINNLSKQSILFVHAPAGYGKTTVVALWSRGRKVVWLSIDAYSSSSASIYKSLLIALSYRISKEFKNSPLEYTLNTLEKINTWPEAIIIDDFHLCSDSSIIEALPLIRARIPMSTSFIILSRNPPPKLFDGQILKGKLKQINDLRFSSEEIRLLFGGNKIPLSKYDSEFLREQTDGWAAALAAILMSQPNFFSKVLDQEILNHYLKSHVLEYWDDFGVLKKCSVCETLTTKLCEVITGQSDSWEIIVSLADKTGLVSKIDNNTYRFHDLLREFLFSELQIDENIDKPSLYKIAANWYKDNDDILGAIILAGKSDDIQLMEECLRIRINEYGKRYTPTVNYVSAIIENIYPKVPKHIAKQSMCFSTSYSSSLFYLGRLHESFEWFDTIKELLKSSEHSRSDLIDASFNLALDPRGKFGNIPIIFKNIIPPEPVVHTENKITRYTLNLDLPFYHRGKIDYTEISPNLDEYLLKMDEQMTAIIGPVFKPVLSLIEAGIRYERNELSIAEKITGEIVQIINHFPPEIQFSSLLLYSEILRVQGKTVDLAYISNMISKTKTHYLSPNFNAYTTAIQLQNGDSAAADAWLARADIENELKFYKLYYYFTTARALIVSGKLSEAETLLERLTAFAEDYRRSSDVIESLTLQAICKWHMKRADDAVRTIVQAIIKADELQIIMLIAKEGHDIVPIIQKVLNRLKYGYDIDILNKSFVNILFLKARTISKYFRGMLADKKEKSLKLSSRQKEILEYLSQNLSYREIGDEIGVAVATVNDHIRKIYEKLNVTNSHDALIKATELGIISLNG